MPKSCNICNSTFCKIKYEFNNITKAWINGESHSDIYHMIWGWIDHNRETLYTYPSLRSNLDDIYGRMVSNDNTQDIVEDFIYGDRYSIIRKEFS